MSTARTTARAVALITVSALGLTACGLTKGDAEGPAPDDSGVTKITVGASPTPHAKILEYVDKELAPDAKLDLEIKTFDDYVQPNVQLSEGTLDAYLSDERSGWGEGVAWEAAIATDDRTVQQSLEIVRRRVDEVGTREPTIQRQGTDRILIQVPGIGSAEELKALIGTTAVPWWLGIPKLTIPLTLGVVAAALTDLDDRLAGRLRNLLITLVCFFVASASIELLFPYPWLFALGLTTSTYGFILLGALGQRYATIAFGALLIYPHDGAGRVFCLMLGVVASDVGGYTAGVLFGKHPMAPAISR